MKSIEKDVIYEGMLIGRDKHVRIEFEKFIEVKDDFEKFSDYYDDIYGFKDGDVRCMAYLELRYGGNGYGPLTEKLFNRLSDREKFRFLCNAAISSNIESEVYGTLQMTYSDEYEGVYLTSGGKKPEPPRKVFTQVCMVLYVSDYLYEHGKSVPFVLDHYYRKNFGLR